MPLQHRMLTWLDSICSRSIVLARAYFEARSCNMLCSKLMQQMTASGQSSASSGASSIHQSRGRRSCCIEILTCAASGVRLCRSTDALILQSSMCKGPTRTSESFSTIREAVRQILCGTASPTQHLMCRELEGLLA